MLPAPTMPMMVAERVFGVSSLFTPFFMGTVVGARSFIQIWYARWSKHGMVGRAAGHACGPYKGPGLSHIVFACTMPDGTTDTARIVLPLVAEGLSAGGERCVVELAEALVHVGYGVTELAVQWPEARLVLRLEPTR